MMTQVENWFAGLSLREKALISIAGALTAVIVTVFLIALPLMSAISSKQTEYRQALERRAQIEMRIGAMQEKTSAPPDTSTSLQAAISQSAAEAGFALDRADSPQANLVDIAMARAKPQALMQWLNGWEARGVSVQQIDMKAANDGTVSVTATWMRPDE